MFFWGLGFTNTVLGFTNTVLGFTNTVLGFTDTVLGSSRALCYRMGPRPTKGRTDAERRGTEREAGPAKRPTEGHSKRPHGSTRSMGQWAQGERASGPKVYGASGPKVTEPAGPRSTGQRGPRSLGQRGVQGHGARGSKDAGARGSKATGPARGPRPRGQRTQGHGARGSKATGTSEANWAIGPGPLGHRAVHAFARSHR
jgi:hypothetical protein